MRFESAQNISKKNEYTPHINYNHYTEISIKMAIWQKKTIWMAYFFLNDYHGDKSFFIADKLLRFNLLLCLIGIHVYTDVWEIYHFKIIGKIWKYHKMLKIFNKEIVKWYSVCYYFLIEKYKMNSLSKFMVH